MKYAKRRLLRSGLPRTGIVALWKTSTGLTDTIGISSRAVKKKQHILMDGTGTLNNANLTATCTITQPNGTSVLTAGAGAISGTAGTAWTFSVTYDDGVIGLYEYAALVGAASAVVFDISGNRRHLVLTGFADVPAACAESVTTGSDWLNQQGHNDASVGLVPYANIATASAATIPAADWFVKKTGLDTNDGLTEGGAFLTIAKAITAASDGDVIHVYSGDYTEATDATYGLNISKAVSIYGIDGLARIQASVGDYLCGFTAAGKITIGSGIEFYGLNRKILRFAGAGEVDLNGYTITTSQTASGSIFYTGVSRGIVRIRKGTINCTTATQTLWTDTAQSGSVEISENTIHVGSNLTTLFSFQTPTGNHALNNNTVTIDSLATASASKSVFLVQNSTGQTVSNYNTYNLPADDKSFAGLQVRSSTAGAKGGVEAHDNITNHLGVSGYGIIVGHETSSVGNNTISPIVLYNNRVTGSGTNAIHSILVGYQSNAIVFANDCIDVGYGVVLKSNGSSTHTDGVVFANKATRCSVAGIYVKGATDINMFNNHFDTCIRDIYATVFETGVPTNLKVKNNTYINAIGRAFIDNQSSAITGFECDNNIGLCGTTFLATIVAQNYTFAQWQTAGYDTNGVNINPEYLDNYSISESSPCYQAGVAITLPAGLITDYLKRLVASLSATPNVGLSAGLPLTPTGSTSSVDALGGHIASDRVGRVKYSLLRDPIRWPSAPDIISRTGVNNAVYDVNGDGITMADDAAALAALASLADDQYLWGGTKAAALYSVNMTAKATAIKRYVGD